MVLNPQNILENKLPQEVNRRKGGRRGVRGKWMNCEMGGYAAKGRLGQNRIIKLFNGGRNTQSGQRIEPSKRMTPFQQFMGTQIIEFLNECSSCFVRDCGRNIDDEGAIFYCGEFAVSSRL
jgi:hypothetical protein